METSPRVLLRFAGGYYDRTRALVEGLITPAGIELDWIQLPYHEIWRRMLNEYEFDASELSLSSYIIARTLGKPLVAIPVFPARAFRHSFIFINTDSRIKEPSDLAGKRVGLHDFQQTASVWIRGILQHDYGVPLESISWFTWSEKTRMEIHIPARYKIKKIPPGSKPDNMLLDGNLDAIITPQKFPSLLANDSHVKRLFENYEQVEKSFYRKTGLFPIMHTVAMREDLFNKHPWIALSLYEAFKKAKKMAYDSLDDWDPYRLSIVWSRETLREQMELFGNDPWPYGVKDNLKTLQTLAGYLCEQGLINSPIDVRELFTPNTRET